jgi:hypothetical protein
MGSAGPLYHGEEHGRLEISQFSSLLPESVVSALGVKAGKARKAGHPRSPTIKPTIKKTGQENWRKLDTQRFPRARTLAYLAYPIALTDPPPDPLITDSPLIQRERKVGRRPTPDDTGRPSIAIHQSGDWKEITAVQFCSNFAGLPVSGQIT